VEFHEIEEVVGMFWGRDDGVIFAGREELEFLKFDPAFWFEMSRIGQFFFKTYYT
jgi:hypothetical protein